MKWGTKEVSDRSYKERAIEKFKWLFRIRAIELSSYVEERRNRVANIAEEFPFDRKTVESAFQVFSDNAPHMPLPRHT